MLFAGGCTDTNESDDDLTSPSITGQPAVTPKPSTPPTEDASVPTKQSLSPPDKSAEKLTYKGVEPDENFISADYATEELLAQYESYEEFDESEDTENQVKVLFEISTTVKDFRLLMIHLESGEDDSLNFCVHKTCYSKDTISPEKPLVVGTIFEGSFPTRAISFVDDNNKTRYFDLSMSGEDGSIILIELVPRKTP